jgi:hypothetical protein
MTCPLIVYRVFRECQLDARRKGELATLMCPWRQKLATVTKLSLKVAQNRPKSRNSKKVKFDL